MNKENADTNETFELFFQSCKVKVEHHCKTTFKDQSKEAREHLIKLIGTDLKANKKDGFIPYDNFECSINWGVK